MSRLQIIRGFPFPNVDYFKRENIERTLDYIPRDEDVIVASYPKTGTTWVQYIVLQIISKGKTFPSFNDVLKKVSPFMEMTGPEAIDDLTGFRFYKHHYRYDMVKKNPNAKVIYVYRHPADTFVSFHNFYQGVWEQKLDLNEYFEGFLSGNIEYGSYFEHISSFLRHKNDDNLLLVSYEKLHADFKENILRIANFLGEEYYQNLAADESLLDDIVKHTSFDYMKRNLALELPQQTPTEKSEESQITVTFFRKGIVGEGKNVLSMDQLKRLQEVARKILKDSEVLEDWFKE